MTRVSFSDAGLFLATLLLAIVALCATLAGEVFAAHANAGAERARGALTVRVLSPATPLGVAAATRVLRRTPGVLSVQPMDGARAAHLLAQWGGATVDPAALPPLHLIEVRRKPTADGRIESDLRGAGLRVELYGAGPADPGAARLSAVAVNAGAFAAGALLLGVGLLFGAASRARGAAAALAADLGGVRGDILARYGRSACEFAFLAGAAAAIACTLCAPGVLIAVGAPVSLQAMAARITSMEVGLVLLAPLVTAGAAALGARAGAARAFDRADRLR